MTFADVAVGSLSAIAPVLISVAGVMFVVFGTIFAVKKIKSFVISSAVSYDTNKTKREYWEEKKKQYYDSHLSYDAKKERAESARFESALHSWNKKVDATQKRIEEKRDYESWKAAHQSMGEYFDKRERERANQEYYLTHFDNNGFEVVDDDDLRAAGTWQHEEHEERLNRAVWHNAVEVGGVQEKLELDNYYHEVGPSRYDEESAGREDWYLSQEKSMSEDMNSRLPDGWEERRKALDEYYQSLRDEAEQYEERES